MEYEFQLSGNTYKIKIDAEGGVYQVDLGDGSIHVDARPISENCLSLIMNNRSYKVYIASNERKKFLQINGFQFCLEEIERGIKTGHVRSGVTDTGEQVVSTPMPGTVVKIQVKEGEEVEKNQSLVIVESMKMENALRSPIDGCVKKIHYADGDLVDAGVTIVEVAPLEGTG